MSQNAAAKLAEDNERCNCTKPVSPVSPIEDIQVQVPVVIGRRSTQILVEAVVPFPAQFPATEIVQTIKTVRDLMITICRNKVLINGVLSVNVVYKTFEGTFSFRHIGNEPEATFGNVKQIGFDVPFAGFVEVPGARPGDDFIVNFAGVEDECQVEILEDPIDPPCKPVLFRRVRVKAIVRIDISVTRNILVPIRNLGPNISPVLTDEDDAQKALP